MAQIDITRNYAEGSVLTEADLDAIQTSLTTFFNTTKLTSDNMQTGGIDGGTKLIDASISTACLEDLSITSAKIANLALTTAKINDGAVTADKLADSSITSAKIASNTLVSTDFADGSVTSAKRASANVVVASTAISYTTAGTSEEAVTNASVTITTTGGSVLVGLMGTDAAAAYIQLKPYSSASDAYISIYRDSTLVHSVIINYVQSTVAEEMYIPASGLWSIDYGVAAGTYTYTIKLNSVTAGDLAILGSPKMYALELT